jgi:nitroreductase
LPDASITDTPASSDRTIKEASDLLRERYGDPAIEPPARWNPVLSALLSHRSVRAYLPTALPSGTLEAILAAAQSASTSSNLQTWSVVAVEDPDRKVRLSDYAGGQKHIRQCPMFLVFLADLARLGAIAKAAGVGVEGTSYLEMLVIGIIDAALAAQNAVVALESLGLGSVYIGGIRNRPEDVAAELALPPHVMPVFGLCIGYPDPAAPADIKPRLPQAAILHRETYSQAAPRASIDGYDATLRAFYQGRGLETPAWTQQSVNRVRTPQSLTGRHRLREALRNLGFELK